MNTLTPQEAALYLGQDCLYTTPPYLPVSCKIDEQALYELKMGVPCEYQLLLRPLSDITEEEAIELVILCGWMPEVDHVYIKNGGIQAWFKHHCDQEGDFFTNEWVNYKELSPKAFAYLLSKGFDLFGHIENNKAIDKTKI